MEDKLEQSSSITQINKHKSAVVAAAMHPARNRHLLPGIDVRFTQIPRPACTEGVGFEFGH